MEPGEHTGSYRVEPQASRNFSLFSCRLLSAVPDFCSRGRNPCPIPAGLLKGLLGHKKGNFSQGVR
jgi:hypothetical protein